MNESIQHIIDSCQKEESGGQKALYDMYRGLLFGICRRYIGQSENAEDVFIEGFYKIFSKIGTFKNEGSFEGWMKRLMVNECLMYIRKHKKSHMTVELGDLQIDNEDLSALDNLQAADVLKMVNELPTGYKTVFNLYVIEGYKHREIAEHLGISINTSKSQLILAKKKLRQIAEKKSITSLNGLAKNINSK